MPTSSLADAAPLPDGAVARTVERIQGDRRERVRDALAAETPVALLFNGIAHVVMMATPCDLEDLARGFALSEGIVAAVTEIGAITVTERLA
ncbi:MAG: formate dehydrogenase accessory sulfurtransferase FdhD, partial [Xanthomonadaceae bacterium]|nr:formate dehydrogenase accessory sulfurtransferase FdhD [Xanthomonadaceae bacterium]